MLNRLSALALPVFILSLVALALRGSLVSSMPLVLGGQLLGLSLMVWARAVFPKGTFRVSAMPASDALLRTGPYRWIRHPMYAGGILLAWASIAGHASIVNVGIGLIASVVVVGKILVEERMLRVRCPGYAEYARSTKALIPFLI